MYREKMRQMWTFVVVFCTLIGTGEAGLGVYFFGVAGPTNNWGSGNGLLQIVVTGE